MDNIAPILNSIKELLDDLLESVRVLKECIEFLEKKINAK